MNRIFISKTEKFILNLNHLSYILVDTYDKPLLYVVGDTRPQTIKKETYVELLAFIKAANSSI